MTLARTANAARVAASVSYPANVANPQTHKGQHLVPRTYLSAWIDPRRQPGHTPFINRISKDLQQSRRKSPTNSFKENNRYTIWLPDGTRDLSVEHWLGKAEDAFVDVRRKIMALSPLTDSDHRTLELFTATLLARSKQMGDFQLGQMSRVVEKIERLEKKKGTDSTQSDAWKEHLKSFYGTWVVDSANPMVRLFPALKRTILATDDPLGFITSDTPVTMYVADAYKRPPGLRFGGMMDPELEIILPITPKRALLFSHKLLNRLYLPADSNLVDKVNNATYFGCEEEFVAWKGETRSSWFVPPVMPADAWKSEA